MGLKVATSLQGLKAGTKMHGQGGKEKPSCVNGEELFSFPIAPIEPRNNLCKPFCDCLVIPPWASKWPLLCRGSKQAPRCMAKGGSKNHPVSMGRSYFLFQWHPLSPEITCASHFVTALSSPLGPQSGHFFAGAQSRHQDAWPRGEGKTILCQWGGVIFFSNSTH